MLLPGAAKAYVHPSKLIDYLLSSTHSKGESKARVLAALGYTRANWTILRDDLVRVALGDVESSVVSPHGDRYAISGLLAGPNGESAVFLTHWIILRDESFPRFVTAYPRERR